MPRTAAILAGALALAAAAAYGVSALLDGTPPAAAAVTEHRSEAHDFRLEIVAEGLAHPWGLAILPDGDMLVTERPGRLRLVRDGRLLEAPVEGVPAVAATGQGGLLDVALHPDFTANRLVYLSYAKPGALGVTTALARGRFEDGRLVAVEDIFVAEAWGPTTRHFGSRIVFDGAGHVFLTIGDRGEQTPAQDLADHKGAVVRLHDDGRVPADNPFAGRAGIRPETWSYGHRNPQGMTRDAATGALWLVEHGPRGGDELNHVRPGVNYGWPVITYGKAYSGGDIGEGITAREGMAQPATYWVPSISPSGLAVYRGAAFPEWQGSLFAGALSGRHLRRIVLDGSTVADQEPLLEDWGQRIRDVRTAPDGTLYLLTDAPEGVLARIAPAG